MTYHNYILLDKHQEAEDTYIYRFSPATGKILHYKPGQYVFMKNPSFKPEEEHPFSLASSPMNPDYLEFCIKTYGDWTETLTTIEQGHIVSISEAQGAFTWDSTILQAVFLLGGIGIAPVMSMLRFMRDMKLSPQSLIMLYGNRTPETVAYRKELNELAVPLPLKVVDIYSHLPENHPWTGYRGFIAKDIVDKEVNFTLKPTFFVIGPPIFIGKMNDLLAEYQVPKSKIRTEDISEAKPA
jgi:ferredoxin-NADP reductase